MILRPLEPADENAALQAHAHLAGDDFEFLLGHTPGTRWSRYLRVLEDEREAKNLADGRVPATFLVAESDGQLVGRVSIRHTLTPFLEAVGGHIGYAVLPEHRRKGHATQILRQSLGRAAELGIGRALVTCDADNVGSRTVIERCGGVLDPVRGRAAGQVEKLRYWLPTAPFGSGPAAM